MCMCMCVSCSCALKQSVRFFKILFFFSLLFLLLLLNFSFLPLSYSPLVHFILSLHACFFFLLLLLLFSFNFVSFSSLSVYIARLMMYIETRNKCLRLSLYVPYINPVFPAAAVVVVVLPSSSSFSSFCINYISFLSTSSARLCDFLTDVIFLTFLFFIEQLQPILFCSYTLSRILRWAQKPALLLLPLYFFGNKRLLLYG